MALIALGDWATDFNVYLDTYDVKNEYNSYMNDSITTNRTQYAYLRTEYLKLSEDERVSYCALDTLISPDGQISTQTNGLGIMAQPLFDWEKYWSEREYECEAKLFNSVSFIQCAGCISKNLTKRISDIIIKDLME